MDFITVSDVHKRYDRDDVLQNFSMRMRQGEFVVLFGPNGCGKSTVLNILSGLLQPDHGEVIVGGKGHIGYVFQNYRDSLLPWRTNLENIAFPLEIAGMNRRERLCKARRLVSELNVEIPLLSHPYQSSGGEQQLIAFLREVIAQPRIILMDEPFSALHHENRSYLAGKMQEIWKKLNLTILLVTHDVSEAVQLGDRVLVMDRTSGGIVKECPVDLPRPRSHEHCQEFIRKGTFLGSRQ